jgi:hypothetical protein
MKTNKEEKTNKNNDEGELSTRAQKAKVRALIKIENNIKGIYALNSLEESLEDVREGLHIYNLSENEEREINEIRGIQKIIRYRIDKWVERIFKDKKTAEVISAHYARHIVDDEMKRLKDQIAAAEVRKNIDKLNIYSEKYLKDAIDRFIYNFNPLYEKYKINQDIWKNIFGAMFLRIPRETVLRVKESILPDYLPKIDSKYLILRINELTRLGDFELIKSKIKAAQSTYKKTRNYNNCERTKNS